MSEVIRIFVEKKDGFNVLAKQTLWDIRHNLGMKSVEDLRYIVRYDLEGLTKEEYDKAKTIVLSEPNADVIYEETLPVGGRLEGIRNGVSPRSVRSAR